MPKIVKVIDARTAVLDEAATVTLSKATRDIVMGTDNSEAFTRAINEMTQIEDGKIDLGSDDKFLVVAKTPRSKAWYYAANCKKCSKPIPVFDDPSKGRAGNIFIGSAKILYASTICGHVTGCDASDLYPLQWD